MEEYKSGRLALESQPFPLKNCLTKHLIPLGKWKWSRSVVSDSLSPPGSSIHGILQARILEWVAISFSRGSFRPKDQTQVSRVAGRCFNLWATRKPKASLIITTQPLLTIYATSLALKCLSKHESPLWRDSFVSYQGEILHPLNLLCLESWCSCQIQTVQMEFSLLIFTIRLC